MDPRVWPSKAARAEAGGGPSQHTRQVDSAGCVISVGDLCGITLFAQGHVLGLNPDAVALVWYSALPDLCYIVSCFSSESRSMPQTWRVTSGVAGRGLVLA